MEGKEGIPHILRSPVTCAEDRKRIRLLLGKPGYIPAPDHLILPEVSFEDYTYCVNRLKALILGEI